MASGPQTALRGRRRLCSGHGKTVQSYLTCRIVMVIDMITSVCTEDCSHYHYGRFSLLSYLYLQQPTQSFPPAANVLLALNLSPHIQNNSGAGMPTTTATNPSTLLPQP